MLRGQQSRSLRRTSRSSWCALVITHTNAIDLALRVWQSCLSELQSQDEDEGAGGIEAGGGEDQVCLPTTPNYKQFFPSRWVPTTDARMKLQTPCWTESSK